MRAFFLIVAGTLSACTDTGKVASTGCAAHTTGAVARDGGATEATASGFFNIQAIAKFNEPWAMTFLPNGDALVTEKCGRLLQLGDGRATQVGGTPQVDYGGQGGMGDVILHPNFSRNQFVYLSWVEAGQDDTRGAAVGRGRLITAGGLPRLKDFAVIWRQAPKVWAHGHYGHRLAFGPDGKLYISSGERQKFDPAQDMAVTLGKIVRLNEDGSVPLDNPWAYRGGVAAQIYTLGHRNPLGLAFDAKGLLWSHEMGPSGGDELNLIERGSNYGWPLVSNGDHYEGKLIPDHRTRPAFAAPKITWNGLSPAGLIIYSGSAFPQWEGNAFVGGLSGQVLIRAVMLGKQAREAERWNLGARVREVEQGPHGEIYVLEDGPEGRLLRLAPR